jgi:hypothetical protein
MSGHLESSALSAENKLASSRARRRAANPSWRRLRRAAGLFVALMALLVTGLAAAELAVRLEPVTAGPEAPGGPVTLRADERLFTLMAALNATGYDDENNPAGMHPVRRAVRAELAGRDLSSLASLRPRLRLCRLIHESQCIHWLLQRGGPPDFERQAEGWWVNAPGFLFLGLDGALSDFYREAGIAELWQRHRPAYEAEIARYQGLLAPSLETTLAYLRMSPPPTGQVVMLPNLLDAYWRGYGPAVGATSYIVSGPAEQPNLGLLQHEFMHPLLNPLVDANLDVIKPDQARSLFARLKGQVSRGYRSWDGILRESVIRAVEVRLAEPAEREQLLATEEDQGFWLVRPLAQQLEAYEQRDQRLPDYMPAWLATLNNLEARRIGPVP